MGRWKRESRVNRHPRLRQILPRRAAPWGGLLVAYGASVAGVAAVTLLIGQVLPRYHVGNIS
ncbi:MAG: hypothetical protein ACRDU0_00640, partial [Mycobacterium sp.]